MSASLLLAARHAPVAVEGICYGQSEVPTRVDAPAAAAVLVQQIAREPVRVARVWSSPWARTRDVAARVADALGVCLVVDPRLSELAFGAWEGRRYEDLEMEAPFQRWMRDWREAAPPGGERLADLVTRVRGWRRDVLDAGEVALAVTHAGVIRALRAESRGVPYEQLMGERVEALTVERLSF